MTTVRKPSGIVLDLLDAAQVGGGTVPAIVGQRVPLSGFAVGGRVKALVVPADDHVRTDIIRFVVDNLSEVVWHRAFFGVWVDRGELFLDVADVLSGLQDALALGRDRGELAIFDLSTGLDVNL